MPSPSLYLLHKDHTPNRERAKGSAMPGGIFSRGWTLQEELLSLRIVSFEETGTYFRTPSYEIY